MLEERRQYSAADKCAYSRVGVGRAVALCITLRALPIAAVRICRLFNSRNGSGQAKVDRIHGGLPRKLELLLRLERSRSGVIGDIEIGNDAKDALLLFILDLGLCHLGWRE